MAAPQQSNVLSLDAKPSASVVYVTPEMAERWLGKNHVNRNIRNNRVGKYASDMANGKWQITGEAIKFDRAGSLVDGQHRLWAVVESGCTVPMFVVRGLDENTQIVLDSGSARTSADNLHMMGVKNAHLVSSIARRRISLTGFNDVSNSEVYDYVLEHPEIAEAARIAARYANRCDVIPSTAGLAAWSIAEIHGWVTSEEFFHAAAEKIGLTPGDPVLAMTAFFAEQRRNRRKLTIEAQLSVIIRAFNYRYEGKQWRTVRVNSPGANGGIIPIPDVAA